MKTTQFLILFTLAAFAAGCATVAPKELVNARSAYRNASEGPAAQLVPAELHKAHESLVMAENSFLKKPKSHETKDLAYVAQRKSELAAVLGAMAADKANKEKADAEFQQKQSEIVIQGKQDLSDSEKRMAETLAAIAAEKAIKEKADADLQQKQSEIVIQGKQDLIDSEKRAAETLAAIAAEKAIKDKADADLQQKQSEIMEKGKQDLIDSEKRTADALAELAKLAAVKEEARGLVVTLSGSILFRSSESALLSSAQDKLDQIAKALLAVRERNIIVEGHTDSKGSESYNQGLSQRRADSVRDYLVQRGYPADRIQSRGKSEGSPIAENVSPEGRANNRRVEIVIERVQAANK